MALRVWHRRAGRNDVAAKEPDGFDPKSLHFQSGSAVFSRLDAKPAKKAWRE